MRILIISLILGISLVACVQPQASYTYHGEKIQPQKAMSVTKLPAVMAEKGTLENVKIEGNIEACCQNKGCWMTMKLDDKTEMRIRFKDYGFFVPMDSHGKTAVVEGRAFYDTIPVDELRHYGMDAGMTKEQADARYQEPEVSINFMATGVAIEAGKVKSE